MNLPLNPLEEFLKQLNQTAQAAADLGAQERLTVWVRQAMHEYPMINGFIASEPVWLLSWLKIIAPTFYTRYITEGCGDAKALELVSALQARLAA